jgi:hypothetical protein
MIGMIIVFVIALAAAGLGYQIGFGRGVRYATQCAEEQAIATAIAHIVTDKFERRRTRGIYSLDKVSEQQFQVDGRSDAFRRL